jgi:hypothetical protein
MIHNRNSALVALLSHHHVPILSMESLFQDAAAITDFNKTILEIVLRFAQKLNTTTIIQEVALLALKIQPLATLMEF